MQPHLVEVGILCGCQPEALLVALKGQQVGQQAGSDSDILAEVVVGMASHLPQPLSQLLGLHGVQDRLIQLQAIQLPDKEEGITLWSFGPFSKASREEGFGQIKGPHGKAQDVKGWGTMCGARHGPGETGQGHCWGQSCVQGKVQAVSPAD